MPLSEIANHWDLEDVDNALDMLAMKADTEAALNQYTKDEVKE